ncbi:MAG: hypothetical protein QNJ13_07695 [Paracoccaceae bacterium]|nr:hypothetical protein [Paracoccaceae bacterium]
MFIETQRNRVYLDRPLPTDTVVATYINFVAGRGYLLCVQPIEQHQQAIDWALSMADYMQGPIVVRSCESEEWLHYTHLYCDMSELAFASADPEVRREAFEVLTSLADWEPIKHRRLQ